MKQKNLLLAVLLLSFSGCSLIPQNNVQEDVANPASEYCEQNGGILEIVPDEGGERGKCNFEDGSFCEEWAFFHGECSPNWGNGNTVELETIQEMQDDENLSQEEKEEISELVEEIQAHDDEDNSGELLLDENIVQEKLKEHESDGTGLSEKDIDLMNEIIDTVIQG